MNKFEMKIVMAENGSCTADIQHGTVLFEELLIGLVYTMQDVLARECPEDMPWQCVEEMMLAVWDEACIDTFGEEYRGILHQAEDLN